MRLVGLLLTLVSIRSAAAQPVEDAPVAAAPAVPVGDYVVLPLAMAGGAEVIGHDVTGSVSAETSAGWHGVCENGETCTADAKAAAELRAGTSIGGSAGGEASMMAGYDTGTGEVIPLSGLWIDASFGNQPALDARRDVVRDTFARAGIGFRLTPLWGQRGKHRSGAIRFGFAGSTIATGDGPRATFTGELGTFFRCYGATCVHVLELDSFGVSGKTQAVVSNFTLLRVSGLGAHGVYVDAGVGSVSDRVSLGIVDDNNMTVAEVKTEDLPLGDALAWNAGITMIAGNARIELRSKRTGYATLDGDMSIDDRVQLTGAFQLAPQLSLTLASFAARTTWWTSAEDPGHEATTGGTELGLGAQLRGYDIRASAGVARSFYPVLDGASPDAPAVGFRTGIRIGRSIDL